MRLKAFSIQQRTGRSSFRIYVTAMQAKQLVENCGIDRWTPSSPEGYQRPLDPRQMSDRRGSAVRYLMRELGCFPTSVLLNVRGELKFEGQQDMSWGTLGELELDDGVGLWLIDGQHRVEALRRAIQRNADFERYPIIVSILQLPSRFDELMLFYIVNRRQRSVPTDLAYRHLQRMMWEKGVDWLYDLEGRKGVRLGLATQIVDYMNEDPRSPWKARIRRVGESRRDEHIIHDKPLIRSVTEILRERAFEGMPIRELADLLIDYWNAIGKVYPGAFRDPRDYTILATPGIFAMHILFPSIYAICARRGLISEEGMRSVLGRLLMETPEHPQPEFRNPVSIEFWSRDHGPSIAIATSLQMNRSLCESLQRKISLAEKELMPREV